MIDTLSALDSLQTPGTIHTLPYRWADDDAWKDTAMRAQAGGTTRDDRVPRERQPQYQNAEDQAAADVALATGGCPTCIFLEDR